MFNPEFLAILEIVMICAIPFFLVIGYLILEYFAKGQKENEESKKELEERVKQLEEKLAEKEEN